MATFTRATRATARLRMGLSGASGSGKTFTALAVASGLGARIAVIDTERGSSSLYSNLFTFDVLELDSFHPQRYIDAIRDAAREGYDVLVIDSLSHAWMGKDGALELVDRAAQRSKSQNSYAAWREVTPLQNQLVDAILATPLHVLVTLRSKTEYVLETNSQGKQAPRKVGLAPVQRDGLEYEFSLFGELNDQHHYVVSKSRFPEFVDQVLDRPGKAFGEALAAVLSNGHAPAPQRPTEALVPSHARNETRQPEKLATGDSETKKVEPMSAVAIESLHRYRRAYQLSKELSPGILDTIPRQLWDCGWSDISRSAARLEAIANDYPLVAYLLAVGAKATEENWPQAYEEARGDFPQLYAEMRGEVRTLAQHLPQGHARKAEAQTLVESLWTTLAELEAFRASVETGETASVV